MKKFFKTIKKRFVKISGRLKLFLALGVVAAVLLGWMFLIFGDVFGWSGEEENVMISIPDGCSVNEIAEILKQEDVIDYVLAFRVYEKIDGEEHLFRKGGHMLKKNMSYGEIIRKLTAKPDVEPDVSVKVTIPEGFENRNIADKLAEMGLVDKDKFIEELENGEFEYDFVEAITRTENRLEGYLFPATYDIYPGESEHDIICRFLDAFEENIVPLYNDAETEFSLDEVVTFASVVEREAANDAERPVVASVFYNRTKFNMNWSSCATVQYILKERKAILSNKDTKIESPYNTYINKGMPVGPIASPGINSVKAVLEPADTDYLYFAARSDGSENVFAKNHDEHLRNVRELQSK